jgi:polyadenylate-binding protein
MSPGPEGPHVDPCNLFIKNLDANISSSDLFNHFRRYGRIISARVMRDQETGNSKGFGFVSYTTAEEADKAKSSMHGKTLGSKQIVVRLHEPKKLREAKLANHFSGSPTSPSDSRPPSRRNSDFFNINTVNEFGQDDLSGLAPKARKEVLMSELQKRFKNIPSIPHDEVNPIIEHLLTSKVPEVLQMLKDPPLLSQRVSFNFRFFFLMHFLYNFSEKIYVSISLDC